MEIKFQHSAGVFPSPWEGKRRGSILILALWAICFLSLLAIILGTEVRQKITLAKRLDEMNSLRFIAEAGIQKAIVEVQNNSWGTYYDSFADTFADNPSVLKGDMAGGTFSVGDYFQVDLSGKEHFRYSLIDEKGKININLADLATLKKLFHIVLGLDEFEAGGLAASIINWRGPQESTESAYYRNLDHPYKEKDSHFELLDEVLLVKGMDEDRYNRIKNYITIYGDGKVNINTASKPVLMALGLDEGLVDKILAYRLGQDGVLDTIDDNIFDTTANIVPKLSHFVSLSDDEVSQLSGVVQSSLVCNSNYFKVESTAQLKGHQNIARTVAVIDRNGKILSWRED